MEKRTEKRTFSEIAWEVLNLWTAKYGKNLPWSLMCAHPLFIFIRYKHYEKVISQ